MRPCCCGGSESEHGSGVFPRSAGLNLCSQSGFHKTLSYRNYIPPSAIIKPFNIKVILLGVQHRTEDCDVCRGPLWIAQHAL